MTLAMSSMVQFLVSGGPEEYPYPGRDGTTTWYGSSLDDGYFSFKALSRSRNSRKLPGRLTVNEYALLPKYEHAHHAKLTGPAMEKRYGHGVFLGGEQG